MGGYGTKRTGGHFSPSDELWIRMSKRDIFISRPSTRNDEQEVFLEHLDSMLEQRELRPVVVG